MENSIAPEKTETKKIVTKEKKPTSKILLVGLILNLPFILFFISFIISLIIVCVLIGLIIYLIVSLFKKKPQKIEPIKKPKIDFIEELNNKLDKNKPWNKNE